MEELIQQVLFLKYGVGAACVLILLFVLFKIGLWVYDIKSKQEAKDKAELDTSLNKAITSVNLLSEEIKQLHGEVAILPKILKDLEKLFFVQKDYLGSEEWNKLMKRYHDQKELNN